MNRCLPLLLWVPVLAACRASVDRVAATDRGEELYRAHCALCHGEEGRGDGPAAYLLFPKPRDFTRGYYKIRTTASGSVPTDEDLFRTISQGMPGSAMPGFAWLPEPDRWALVEVVKGFSDAFETFEPEVVPTPPPPPEMDAEILALGAEKYQALGCGKCHGEAGKGNGPSAADLRDDWDQPSRPNDFTRGIYKGGGANEDIYLRFATGMDGTPMPSFLGTAAPREIWALVYYVKSLAGTKVAVQPTTGVIDVRRVTEALPSDPGDSRWTRVEAAEIPLMTLWQRNQVVETVEVRALHDGNEIAILAAWDDPTPAWSTLRGEDFSDAVGLEFSLSEPPPHFAMGSAAEEVNLWQWRADRQIAAARGVNLSAAYPLRISDASESTPQHRAARDAGNPISHEPPFVVQDLNAAGLGTVTVQPSRQQNVSGRGIWEDGRWKVVFRRVLRSPDPEDAVFAVGSTTPVAFAVWDGDRGDRDGQKAVSTWYQLRLRP